MTRHLEQSGGFPETSICDGFVDHRRAAAFGTTPSAAVINLSFNPEFGSNTSESTLLNRLSMAIEWYFDTVTLECVEIVRQKLGRRLLSARQSNLTYNMQTKSAGVSNCAITPQYDKLQIAIGYLARLEILLGAENGSLRPCLTSQSYISFGQSIGCFSHLQSCRSFQREFSSRFNS
jgi:hypothetical protein